MSDCDHSSVGTPADAVQFFSCCHRYKKGDRYLTSVSKVIREVWPVKPSWDGVDEAVVANARERGIECDSLFSNWINGKLAEIPADMRQDAVARFDALRAWWKPQKRFCAQFIVADDELAGTVDLIFTSDDGVEIWDVKNTAQIESTYTFQIAAYCDLYERQHGERPRRGGVLHVTQPKGKPARVRPVEFNLTTALSEWRVMREFYTLVQRRLA